MNVIQALKTVSKTHPGMVRAHNEDSVSVDVAAGLVVLADGMGGYNAGEVASGIAISVTTTEIARRLKFESAAAKAEKNGVDNAVTLLRNNIQKANSSIYHASQSQPQYAGMGTTIVAGLFYDNRVAVAHIGDSRMYRLRGEKLTTVTRDHSLLQEQIDSGLISVEDARFSKNKNLVTRAVGIDPNVEPEIHVYPVQIGDVYLLCSDGLNDMVEDADIESALYAMQGNLPLAAEQLIQMANDNGGRDNVSVILVKITADFAEPKSWWAKFLHVFQK
ncbi:MAG: Stp1/IreP family PP2C-type Ser/Thr phosphatase [Sideroxydans sp.]|nr:Stp1/IreP family PP2C-type Ser/Thr phosphatase [Sideroxydans sp.]